MEIIIQHRNTGMFARQDGEWASTSIEAAAFDNTVNASRFAVASGWAQDARLVARIECGTHRILMPLLGRVFKAGGAGDQRSGRANVSVAPRF